MKPFILVADGMDKDLFAELRGLEHFDVHEKAKNSQEEIQSLLPKVEGLVIRSATAPDQAFMDAAPNLKYIIRAGEGTDNIDKKYAGTKGVKVSNTPGANNNSAAEHAIALMMTVLRKTAHANASMLSGKWEKPLFTGVELSNKTIGVVGFGRIGQIVAKRLAGFDPKVLFFDPFVKESELPYAEHCSDLERLFSESDIITIHTPLVDATKNLVDKKLLSLMKPGAIIVNAARGKIVVEEDLHKILAEGKIRGAGFDVFAEEPLPENSPLRKLENIVLTPHLGASTEEAQLRVGRMVIDQLNSFFKDGKCLNEVKA